MLNVENVATPFTAFTLVVPESVPPPGFAPIATVIDPRSEERRVGDASSAATRTTDIVCAACVDCGCVGRAPYASCGGGGAVMLNLALVAPVSPLALALSV